MTTPTGHYQISETVAVMVRSQSVSPLPSLRPKCKWKGLDELVAATN